MTPQKRHNQTGRTPLMYAVRSYTSPIVVVYLCSHGADVNALSNVSCMTDGMSVKHDVIAIGWMQDKLNALDIVLGDVYWAHLQLWKLSVLETIAVLLNYGADLFAITQVIHFSP